MLQFAEWCFDYGKHGCRTPDTPMSLFEGKNNTTLGNERLVWKVFSLKVSVNLKSLNQKSHLSNFALNNRAYKIW